MAAIGLLDGNVRISKLKSQDAQVQFKGRRVLCLTARANGQYLVGSLDGYVETHDTRSGETRDVWSTGPVNAIASDSRGNWVVSGSDNGVVTLRGSVRDRFQREEAEVAARRLHGVRDVRNEIAIGRGPTGAGSDGA